MQLSSVSSPLPTTTCNTRSSAGAEAHAQHSMQAKQSGARHAAEQEGGAVEFLPSPHHRRSSQVLASDSNGRKWGRMTPKLAISGVATCEPRVAARDPQAGSAGGRGGGRLGNMIASMKASFDSGGPKAEVLRDAHGRVLHDISVDVGVSPIVGGMLVVCVCAHAVSLCVLESVLVLNGIMSVYLRVCLRSRCHVHSIHSCPSKYSGSFNARCNPGLARPDYPRRPRPC